MEFRLVFSNQALKDVKKLESTRLDRQTKELLKVIINNPFQNPPPYEKLKGDLKGMYSRRINIQHRIVYEVYKEEKVIRILSMWSHYE